MQDMTSMHSTVSAISMTLEYCIHISEVLLPFVQYQVLLLCLHLLLFSVQSNLDYPDSLGLHEILRIIEGPDNREYEY